MTRRSSLITAGYLAGIALAALLIVWAESWAWRRVDAMRAVASAVDVAAFHLSERLAERTREAVEIASAFVARPDAAGRSQVAQTGREFREWRGTAGLDTNGIHQADSVGRAREAAGAFAEILENPPLVSAGSTVLTSWRGEIGVTAGRLYALSREFEAQESQALRQFVVQVQDGTASLHRVVVLSSAILLMTGGVLTWLVFQGLIQPLRRNLQRSRLIIERQEKLGSLGVLAAGVAHEIRNPLTSIKARLFTQQALLRRGTEEWEDNVFITEEISRLEKIVRDFLAFARPSEPDLQLIRATQPFRDVAALLRHELQSARITLEQQFLADPQINVDAAQLKQVLINLVKNAAESVGQDGTITLRTRTAAGRRVAAGLPEVWLEVLDTGGGIAPEVQKRLFDPFFTTKAGGTGLGLSVAARILEKHGGRLEYESQPGQGALFRVVLPMAHHSKADT